MKTFKIIPWQFDAAAWAAAVTAADNDMNGTLHLFLDVSDSCVHNWSGGHFHESAPYPNMTNLIKFCNLVDCDPRSFFILAAE